MKFTQKLQAQSGKWAPYNIDYTELKNLIKVHTTTSSSQAIVIPGQADKLLQQFEKSFYHELLNQHERLGLFVKSKVDEICRRLPCSNSSEVTSSRRRVKFVRYHAQIQSCGEDIKCMQKFISIQREAFHRILKKYTKWTGSRYLTELFDDEILSCPKSFLRQDLNYLLDQHQKTHLSLQTAAPDLAHITNHTYSRLQGSQISRKNIQTEIQPQQAYWNEYDGGSEVEDEPYIVYIDPESDTFPGSKTLAYVISKAKKPVVKVREWLVPTTNLSQSERRSLLKNDNRVYSIQQSSIVDSEVDEAYGSYSNSPDGYSTFNPPTTALANSIRNVKYSKPHPQRESMIFHAFLGCYAASLTFLLISWLLAATGKKKLQREVDVGVVIGVVASLVFATLGFVLMRFRRQRFSVIQRCCACFTFIFTCLLNGILLIQIII